MVEKRKPGMAKTHWVVLWGSDECTGSLRRCLKWFLRQFSRFLGFLRSCGSQAIGPTAKQDAVTEESGVSHTTWACYTST